MYTRFVNEQTDDLITPRMTIKQVTQETMELANYLMSFSNDHTYITRITNNRLQHTKYFIAYVDEQPVCVSGFSVHKWGYDRRMFSILGNVTVPGHEEHGYMIEMRQTLLNYLTEFGFGEIHVQIHKDIEVSITMHKQLGFKHVKTFEDHVFMKRMLGNVHSVWRT